MTTLLEQARQINQKRDFPYYIQPKNGKFIARHDFYRLPVEETFYSSAEVLAKHDSSFPAFDTVEEAREYIQDTLIEEAILQAERDMEKWQIWHDSDIC